MVNFTCTQQLAKPKFDVLLQGNSFAVFSLYGHLSVGEKIGEKLPKCLQKDKIYARLIVYIIISKIPQLCANGVF